jgi:hypothetical protein
MTALGPKATSVTEQGEPDGFATELGWERQVGNAGDTRLLVSVPTRDLARVHAALVRALGEPLAVLYRRCVNRLEPRPNGAPPEDFLAHELSFDEVFAAMADASDLLYHDARCELWVRGLMGEQVILDQDGMLYAYPDDPSFRDALAAARVPEREVPVLLDRDYVKHHYHAACDPLEQGLLRALFMVPVSPQDPA